MEAITDTSDVTLLRDAVRGDGAAFGALFERHRDRLFRAALRATSSPTDAEDVVAAAFLEMWRRRDAVRIVDGSVLPWLLVTTNNVARNLTRFQRRHRAFLSRLPEPRSEPSAEEVTVEAAEVFRQKERAAGLLAALAPADAQILTLVLIDELTLHEVSKALGISLDAAKQRLSRARRRARAHDALVALEPAAGGQTR